MEASHSQGGRLDEACSTARKRLGAGRNIEEINMPRMRNQERCVEIQVKAKIQHSESQMHDFHESEFIEMLELHLRGQVAKMSDAC